MGRLLRCAPWTLVVWLLYWIATAFVPIAGIVVSAAPGTGDFVATIHAYKGDTEFPESPVPIDLADADTMAVTESNPPHVPPAEPSACNTWFFAHAPTRLALARAPALRSIPPPDFLRAFQRLRL